MLQVGTAGRAEQPLLGKAALQDALSRFGDSVDSQRSQVASGPSLDIVAPFGGEAEMRTQVAKGLSHTLA